MDNKKKLTYAVMVIFFLIVGYLVVDMFTSDSGSIVTGPKTVTVPNPDVPKKAEFQPQQAVQQLAQQVAGLTERERQLIALQRETETKYLVALNELQMLKVERDIAEANKDISIAKLDTITAQKSIVDMLTPPKPEAPAADAYAKGLDQSAPITSPPPSTASADGTMTTTTTTTTDTGTAYTVVSVTRLRGQWMAVLGAQGKLISVKEGDILGADGTTVLTIDNSGVLLEKKGNKQKISMMPII